MLQLSFKVDTITNCNVRVSCCVSEEKNADNIPTMFYTPNRDDYVQSIDMQPGMQQEIINGMLIFKMSALTPYELTKRSDAYTPLIISINYQAQGHNYAFIDYCVFTIDSQKKITGARSVKQVVLVNGMPFEIKSIFGLTNPDEINSQGQVKQVEGQAMEAG